MPTLWRSTLTDTHGKAKPRLEATTTNPEIAATYRDSNCDFHPLDADMPGPGAEAWSFYVRFAREENSTQRSHVSNHKSHCCEGAVPHWGTDGQASSLLFAARALQDATAEGWCRLGFHLEFPGLSLDKGNVGGLSLCCRDRRPFSIVPDGFCPPRASSP